MMNHGPSDIGFYLDPDSLKGLASILVLGGFIGSFEAPWSEWRRSIDPDVNHVNVLIAADSNTGLYKTLNMV